MYFYTIEMQRYLHYYLKFLKSSHKNLVQLIRISSFRLIKVGYLYSVCSIIFFE